jgi:hypothetical protein
MFHAQMDPSMYISVLTTPELLGALEFTVTRPETVDPSAGAEIEIVAVEPVGWATGGWVDGLKVMSSTG